MLIDTTEDKILMFGTNGEMNQWFPVIHAFLQTPWSEPTFQGFTGYTDKEGNSIGLWEVDNPSTDSIQRNLQPISYAYSFPSNPFPSNPFPSNYIPKKGCRCPFAKRRRARCYFK